MRINKEVISLSKCSNVIFIGNGSTDSCFLSNKNVEIFLFKERRNSFLSFLKQYILLIKLFCSKRIHSLHIINENLLFVFFPFTIFKRTVLDIFDSIFLKANRPGEKLALIKQIVYSTSNIILVTDVHRMKLMPERIRYKCRILPNYPIIEKEVISVKQKNESLVIIYYGWMGLNRGTEIIEGLINTGNPIKIIMAGWFSDNYTRDLPHKYSQIDFRGVVPQKTAMKWAEEEADYILCVYSPINTNNIYASPNKIYDAIHTNTPVLINKEVKVSELVTELGIGLVINSYQVLDYSELYSQLKYAKGIFSWSFELAKEFSWNKIEFVLIKSHCI
jgi:hypothetical protein